MLRRAPRSLVSGLWVLEVADRACLATTGRFGKREAHAEYRTATEQVRTARMQVREVWGGEPPSTPTSYPHGRPGQWRDEPRATAA